MIERHAARYQVPPGSAWIKLDVAFAREALQRFDFDERNLPIGVARLAKGPLLPAIAIPVQPTPGDGPGLFQVMEILPLLFGEIDAFQYAPEHRAWCCHDRSCSIARE